MVAIGLAINVAITIKPARLTFPARLRNVATINAKKLTATIVYTLGLMPRKPVGRETSRNIYSAGRIWLPVRPRRKTCLVLKGAASGGAGGEAIRYHPRKNFIS